MKNGQNKERRQRKWPNQIVFFIHECMYVNCISNGHLRKFKHSTAWNFIVTCLHRWENEPKRTSGNGGISNCPLWNEPNRESASLRLVRLLFNGWWNGVPHMPTPFPLLVHFPISTQHFLLRLASDVYDFFSLQRRGINFQNGAREPNLRMYGNGECTQLHCVDEHIRIRTRYECILTSGEYEWEKNGRECDKGERISFYNNEYNITEMPCATRYGWKWMCAILDSLIKRNRNRTETFFKWIEWSSYCYGGGGGRW